MRLISATTGIEKYSGIERSKIKAGISVLVNQHLVYIDQVQRAEETGVRHTYRIVGIDPYRHMGHLAAKKPDVAVERRLAISCSEIRLR